MVVTTVSGGPEVHVDAAPEAAPEDRFVQTYSMCVCPHCDDAQIPETFVRSAINQKTGVKIVTATCPHCRRVHEQRFRLNGDQWSPIAGSYRCREAKGLEERINDQMEQRRREELAEHDRKISVARLCLEELERRRPAIAGDLQRLDTDCDAATARAATAQAEPPAELVYSGDDGQGPHIDVTA